MRSVESREWRPQNHFSCRLCYLLYYYVTTIVYVLSINKLLLLFRVSQIPGSSEYCFLDIMASETTKFIIKPVTKSGTGALSSILTPIDLMYMKYNADKLLGAQNYQWSVVRAGPTEFHAATLAVVMGGHVYWLLPHPHNAWKNTYIVSCIIRAK